MIKIPEGLQKKYSVSLTNSDVPPDHYKHFRKWLRYYLDFCQKYQHPYADENSLLLFQDKLHQKKQAADQLHQAQKAVRLYYSGLDRQNDPQAGSRIFRQLCGTHEGRRVADSYKCPGALSRLWAGASLISTILF